MNSIEVPPYAPTLMESTRAIGYSLEAAIADIIDNSITAYATKVDVNFFPIGHSYISVLDNGNGMSCDEINTAMQYGSKSPSEDREGNDLGRFGLGLKTASLSQCRTLTVISSKAGLICGRQWDLDYVQMTGRWSLLILEDIDMTKMPDFDNLQKLKSGTLIIWQNLDRLSAGDSDFSSSLGHKMDRVREHISLVFHRFLAGEPGLKKIKIFINNKEVFPADPYINGKSTQIMDDEVIIVRGKKVTLKPYILPHVSKLSELELKAVGGKDGLRKQQGFYVYRNKRLLVWGTWFRMIRKGDLSKLARVQVDIPNSLDDLWTLDIKKSTAVPPEEVRKSLSNVIEKIAEGSRRTWIFRGKKETDDTRVHVWNRLKTRENGIIYEINRDYPLIKQIESCGTQVKKILDMFILQIEGNLPLNSLYIDLTNDEKLENDTRLSRKVAIDLLKTIISVCTNEKEKFEMVEGLKFTEPFSEFYEDICEALESGSLYEEL